MPTAQREATADIPVLSITTRAISDVTLALQNFSATDAVRLADQTLRLHPFDQSGRPVVADL